MRPEQLINWIKGYLDCASMPALKPTKEELILINDISYKIKQYENSKL